MQNTDEADAKLTEATVLLDNVSKLMDAFIIKLSSPDNPQTIELKEAISMLHSARLHVGQTLYFTYKDLNSHQKKPLVSLPQFLRAVAAAYPGLSYRTYQRCFRVYERLVIGCGLWISDLEITNFGLLTRVAECRNLTPLRRRELILEIRKKLDAGIGYAQISERLDAILKHYRTHPEKLPDAVAEADRRLSDVKMDFNLFDSEVDDRQGLIKVPKRSQGYGPRVVIPLKKQEY